MTFLEALREIRPLIESGDQRFICFALQSIGADQYRGRIKTYLDGACSYGGWVQKYHPLVFREMKKIGAFRDGRLQWIDYMIQQEERRLDYTAASVKVSKIATRID